jgi:hypothetical protein
MANVYDEHDQMCMLYLVADSMSPYPDTVETIGSLKFF